MSDIKDPRLLYAKGALFLLGGALASFLLLYESPHLRTAMLLAIAVWCFARAYYFAFYVIEHYVDPSYKFAGLGSFARYLLRRALERDIVSSSGDSVAADAAKDQRASDS